MSARLLSAAIAFTVIIIHAYSNISEKYDQFHNITTSNVQVPSEGQKDHRRQIVSAYTDALAWITAFSGKQGQ